MFPPNDAKVIDPTVSRSDFVVRIVIVQRLKVRKTYRIWKNAYLRIVEGGAINPKLCLIEYFRREDVIERNHVILRSINDLLLIQQIGERGASE